jgi:hypothetical protein
VLQADDSTKTILDQLVNSFAICELCDLWEGELLTGVISQQVIGKYTTRGAIGASWAGGRIVASFPPQLVSSDELIRVNKTLMLTKRSTIAVQAA